MHFPWCLKKCPYCDFLSLATEPERIPHEEYADAVIRELDERRQGLGPYRLASVFFGGGTPSLWQPRALARVLRAIRTGFESSERPETKCTPPVEVTVECNPTSFTHERAAELEHAGVNRVSLGVQSLDEGRLDFLGRWHSADEALNAVRTAVDVGFERVSADLIFGVTGQAPDAARNEASRLLDLGLTHLSAYALTIEPGTQFGALHQKGRLPLLSDDVVAESYLTVHDAVTSRGLDHYEISNYARPGQESVHNLGYWRGHDYLGLGTGAWGTLTDASGTRARYRNTPSPERYLATGAAFAEREHARETIDAETALTERILLGLRLTEGVNLDETGTELGIDPWTPERRRAVDRLLAQGQLELRQGRLRIPSRHWLLADGIVSRVA